MQCNKCGGTKIKMRKDGRGLPEAVCADCGAFIKKMGATEVVAYFEEKELEVGDISAPEAVPDTTPRATGLPCRYCVSEWYIRTSLEPNARPMSMLDQINYCPMCGRKLDPSDRAY